MQGKANLFVVVRKFLLLVAYISSVSAGSSTNEPPSIGNFSLPTSQQPGPFFSFGLNIIDKDQLLTTFMPNYSYSNDEKALMGSALALYGITDSASVLVTLPIVFDYKQDKKSLAGIGDLSLNLEYAFYTHDTKKYSDQATVFFAPAFPVSTLDLSDKFKLRSREADFSRRGIVLNLNTMSYLIGATYSRTLVKWYGFISPGVLLIEKQELLQQGKQYYYNLGIGYNLKSEEKKYIFLGLLEFNGELIEQTKFESFNAPNSGGTILYASPSLWFSTPKLIIQLGFSIPIAQQWQGNQSNMGYSVGGIISWTIH